MVRRWSKKLLIQWQHSELCALFIFYGISKVNIDSQTLTFFLENRFYK